VRFLDIVWFSDEHVFLRTGLSGLLPAAPRRTHELYVRITDWTDLDRLDIMLYLWYGN